MSGNIQCGLNKECAEIHERVKVLEVEARSRDLLNIELKKAIQDLNKAIKKLNEDYIRVNEMVAKHEIKIKQNCDSIKQIKNIEMAAIKNTQWKLIGSSIGFLILIIGYLLDKYVLK